MEPIRFRIINRAALILKPKRPFFDWVNSFSPTKLEPGKPTYDFSIYLVDPPALGLDPTPAVAKHYEQLSELELADALQDRSRWPPNRDLHTFHEWFDVEMHSILVDLVNKPVRHEELGA